MLPIELKTGGEERGRMILSPGYVVWHLSKPSCAHGLPFQYLSLQLRTHRLHLTNETEPIKIDADWLVKFYRSPKCSALQT